MEHLFFLVKQKATLFFWVIALFPPSEQIQLDSWGLHIVQSFTNVSGSPWPRSSLVIGGCKLPHVGNIPYNLGWRCWQWSEANEVCWNRASGGHCTELSKCTDAAPRERQTWCSRSSKATLVRAGWPGSQPRTETLLGSRGPCTHCLGPLSLHFYLPWALASSPSNSTPGYQGPGCSFQSEQWIAHT